MVRQFRVGGGDGRENCDAQHYYRRYRISRTDENIIGRMGIPYRDENLYLISIAIDAPMDKINTLTGRLGRLPGVSAKAVYAKRS